MTSQMTSGLVAFAIAMGSTGPTPAQTRTSTTPEPRQALPGSVVEPTTRAGARGFFATSPLFREMSDAWEAEPLLRLELAATASAAVHLREALAYETGARRAAEEFGATWEGAAREAQEGVVEAARRAWWESPWAFPVGVSVGAVLGGAIVLGVALR